MDADSPIKFNLEGGNNSLVQVTPILDQKHSCRRLTLSPLPGVMNGTSECDTVSMTSTQIEDEDEQELSGDKIKVLIRVRPFNDREMKEASNHRILKIYGNTQIETKEREKTHLFRFNKIFPETAMQQDVFDYFGPDLVDNCIRGYNSSVFCYGQTGAGKTYTVLGELGLPIKPNELRGIAPRVFEYLFTRIAQEENQAEEGSKVQYSCRCSFFEIYNENISDLLAVKNRGQNLQVREDMNNGPYIENLSEETIVNVEEAMELLIRGQTERKVGETMMNKQSSRSHSVFTCSIERKMRQHSGAVRILRSRLHLVDLAGSERQKSAQSEGTHFREACHINKSLTTLGRVIMELCDSFKKPKRRIGNQHIPYRDSRLTYLLQDSLGGNAKTTIIATISPSSICMGETFSTLQFANRAKNIKNRPTKNEDNAGDVATLHKEIARLSAQIEALRDQKGSAKQTAALEQQLKELQQMCETQRATIDDLNTERKGIDRKQKQLEKQLVQMQHENECLQKSTRTTLLNIHDFLDLRFTYQDDKGDETEVNHDTSTDENSDERDEFRKEEFQPLETNNFINLLEVQANYIQDRLGQEREMINSKIQYSQQTIRDQGCKIENLETELSQSRSLNHQLEYSKSQLQSMIKDLQKENQEQQELKSTIFQLEKNVEEQAVKYTQELQEAVQVQQEIRSAASIQAAEADSLCQQQQQKILSLQNQLQQLRSQLGSKESELSEERLKNARFERAMEEINKVIKSAKTPRPIRTPANRQSLSAVTSPSERWASVSRDGGMPLSLACNKINKANLRHSVDCLASHKINVEQQERRSVSP